jgi:hypothetical protein
VWTDHAFALLDTLNLSRVSVAYASGSSIPALSFIGGAAARGIKVDRNFVIGSSDDGVIGDLRHAREMNAVYIVLFGGPTDAFNVMRLAAANDLYFECILTYVTIDYSVGVTNSFLFDSLSFLPLSRYLGNDGELWCCHAAFPGAVASVSY